jgi:hypothetical protein
MRTTNRSEKRQAYEYCFIQNCCSLKTFLFNKLKIGTGLSRFIHQF